MTEDEWTVWLEGITTQFEAALEQLNAGIDLFLAHRYSAALTLCGAAEEILGGLMIVRGGKPEDRGMTMIQSWLQEEEEKRPLGSRRRGRLNDARNWLKHYSEQSATDIPAGLDGTATMNSVLFIENLAMIVRAIKNLEGCSALPGEEVDKMRHRLFDILSQRSKILERVMVDMPDFKQQMPPTFAPKI